MAKANEDTKTTPSSFSLKTAKELANLDVKGLLNYKEMLKLVMSMEKSKKRLDTLKRAEIKLNHIIKQQSEETAESDNSSVLTTLQKLAAKKQELAVDKKLLKTNLETATTDQQRHDIHGKIAEIQTKIAKIHNQMYVISQKNDADVRSQAESYEDIAKQLKLKSVQEKLSTLYNGDALNIQERISTIAQDHIASLIKINDIEERIPGIAKSTLDIHQATSAAFENQAKNLVAIGQGELEQISLTGDRENLLKLIEQTQAEIHELGKVHTDDAAKLRDELRNMVNDQRALLDANTDMIPVLKKEQLEYARIESAVEGMQGKVDSFISAISNMPGGNMLVKGLGLDTFQKEFSEKMKATIVEARATGASAGGALSTGLMTGLKSMGGMVMGILASPLGIALLTIGLIIGAVMALKKAFTAIEDETIAVSTNLGTSLTAARELANTARSYVGQLGPVAASLDEILAAQSAITKATGVSSMATKDAIQAVINLKELYGTTSEEAAGFAKHLQMMGQKNIDTYTALSTNLADIAGIPINELMGDIAQSAEVVHKYFNGNAIAMMKTAVAARRLGLALSDIGTMTEQIMEVGTSIQAEMEAQVITGRNINFDKARQLVLMGDMQGAMESMISQMGDISKFEKASFIEKEAMAKAMGLSVEKLSEMVMFQNQLNDLDDVGKKAYADGVKLLEQMDKKTGDRLLKEQASQMAGKQLATAWGNIKTELMTAIIPLVEKLAPIMMFMVSALGKVVSLIGKLLPGVQKTENAAEGVSHSVTKVKAEVESTLGPVAKVGIFIGKWAISIFAVYKGLKLLKALAWATGGAVTNAVTGVKNIIAGGGRGIAARIMAPPVARTSADKPIKPPTSTSKSAKALEGFSKIRPAQLLAVAAAMIAFAAAIWILSKAFQEFSKVNMDGFKVGISVMAIFAIAIIAIGTSLTTASPFLLAGAVVMLAFAASIWVLSKAFENFGKVAGVFFDGMAKLKTANKEYKLKSEALRNDLILQLSESGRAENLKAVSMSIDTITTSLSNLTTVLRKMDGGLFRKDSIDVLSSIINNFEKFAKIVDPLLIVANALMQVATAMTILSSIDGKAITSTLSEISKAPIPKMGAIQTTALTPNNVDTAVGALGHTGMNKMANRVLESNAISKMTGATTNTPVSPTQIGQTNTTYSEMKPMSNTVINNEANKQQQSPVAAPVQVDTSEIVSVLKQILTETSKPAVIKLGDKFVGEMDSRLAMKRNTTTGLDNSYGRFVR